MLVSLAVRDLVLIDGLVLELGDGLNVLSGETGAGKSILVDALALVLGGRANPELVRTGRDAAEVEALFDLAAAPAVRKSLEEAGLLDAEGSSELVVRRVVGVGGRSKAYVNGRLVTAAQLAAIVRGLVDVSSQHESQTLCDAGTHAELLDAYAKLGALCESVGRDVAAVAALGRQIAEVRARGEALRAREDFLRFQLHELDELDVKAGEEHELEAQRTRLRHADRLSSSTRRAAERLEDGEGNVLDALRRIAGDVAHANELDQSLQPHLAALESAMLELSEVARALDRYAGEVEADPTRLAEIEERLFKIQRLLRKHGPTTDELAAHREALAAELAGLDGLDANLDELETERRKLLVGATAGARTLSKKRTVAARTLGDAIARELSTLAMGRARIVVDVAPVTTESTSAEDELAVELEGGGHARLTRSGLDRVEIMIAPNPGEEPRPLRRIASGGELSRALLAVKRVLAGAVGGGQRALYVFDEVDAGVGGAVAEAIGRKIADVARHHQVLCITHLPQIAAFADVHFAVAKREDAGRTVTEVRRLEGKTRIEELARMLGGSKITPTTRRAAEELLDNARGAVGKKRADESPSAAK